MRIKNKLGRLKGNKQTNRIFKEWLKLCVQFKENSSLETQFIFFLSLDCIINYITYETKLWHDPLLYNIPENTF